MLRPRVIPCLLVRDKGLVKTVQFGESKYVGDPLNAVRIFNEKEVDELIVLDIDATSKKREPDYKLIESLAAECRMPLCYGGGLSTANQVRKVISLGVEKVAISAESVRNPEFVSEIAQQIGSQSVVVVVDVKKKGLLGKYSLVTHNGSKVAAHELLSFIQKVDGLGAGEIVVNSIDRDGMMDGYDVDLIVKIRKLTKLPITVLGGAGSLDDISALFSKFGIVGAAAGSLFVFKGVYKAVLINYPGRDEKSRLWGKSNLNGGC